MKGELHLNPKIAPQVPAGSPRPLAPGEYIDDPNGQWSSEITNTVQMPDGKWSVVPSMWIVNGKPVRVDEDTAVKYAAQSKLPFRRFATEDEAEKWSQQREDKWQGVDKKKASSVAPLWGQQ